jgi:hypothetical protein
VEAVAIAESARAIRTGKVLSVAASERDLATRTNATRLRADLAARSDAANAAA